MDRLSNFTKRVMAVPKNEVEREERQWQKARATRKTTRHKNGKAG
jgi:hypothetical protein